MTETIASTGAVAASDVRTFLIADIRGYTTFTLERGDAAAAQLAARFAELTGDTVAARGGEVIELRGDEALAVFGSTRGALRAASELQERFAREVAENPALPLRVGIGLDAGEAIPLAGGFRGAALNLAARLCSLAAPGEVLASETVTSLARKVDGLDYLDRGTVQLKGFADLVKVIEVKPSDASFGTPHPIQGVPDARSPKSAATSNFPLLDAGAVSGVRSSTGGTFPGTKRLPIGGFLGSLPSGPLVGRVAELERAVEAVQAAADGAGRLLLLAGEPGAGKTRLAQEITLNLRDRGFLIVAGRCYEPQSTVPFFPFLDTLTSLYAGAPESIRTRVPRMWPDLARLLPALGLPMSDFAGPQDQQRLFWAVTGFIQTIAGDEPVALLLDDLHWADAASLELLQHLARHTGGDRVFLLGTYRDVEVGRQHPLEGALRDLQREDLVERIDVRRLGHEETAELIATTMGQEGITDEFADLVYGRTEGNPFFVQQVMRVLVERGDVFRIEGRWDRRSIEEIEVPESVRSVVGQRLSRLTGDAQEILREASVLGQTFLFDDLQAMSHRPEKDLEAALDAAAGGGLVRDMGRDSYGFDHALTQGSLYGELSSRRRRRLHLAAGEAIDTLPEHRKRGREAELAWHFLEGDDPERALRWSLLAAVRSEALFAHSDAEYHYRVARRLAMELGDSVHQAHAAENLGRTLYNLARNDEALPMLEEAADIYRTLRDAEAEVRAVAAIGSVLFQQTRNAEGIERLLPVLREREGEVGSDVAAALLVELGNLFWALGQYEEALPCTERAATWAQEGGDTRLEARAEFRRGTVLQSLKREADGLMHLERAIALAETSGDLITLARSLNNRALYFITTRQWDKAQLDMERQLEVSRRVGNPDQIVWSLGRLASLFWSHGDWPQTEPYLEELLRIGTRLRRTRSMGHVASALLMQAMMGRADAITEIEELVAEGERTGDVALWNAAEISLASLELRERPQEARRRVRSVLSHGGIEDQYRSMLSAVLLRAHVLCGDLDDAEALLAQEPDSPTSEDAQQADWWIGEGSLRARQGRWDDALRAFNDALDLGATYESPFIQADALLEMAVMYRLKGEPGEARDRAEAALTMIRPLGVELIIQYGERVLRDIESGLA